MRRDPGFDKFNHLELPLPHKPGTWDHFSLRSLTSKSCSSLAF